MPPTPAGSPFGPGCDEREAGAGGDEHGAAVSLARDPDDRLWTASLRQLGDSESPTHRPACPGTALGRKSGRRWGETGGH